MKHSFTRSKTLLRFFILMLSVFPFSQLCAGQAGCFLRRIFIASRWHPALAARSPVHHGTTSPVGKRTSSTVGPHRLHRDPSATLRQTHPPPTTPELFATFLPPAYFGPRCCCKSRYRRPKPGWRRGFEGIIGSFQHQLSQTRSILCGALEARGMQAE